jgi:VCBS repeat-containing protein
VLVVGAPGLLSNDTDIDLDALTVDTSPIVNVVNGALSLASDGSFTYTPDPNYNGVDTFTYEIDDGAGGTSQASVTITVTPVNDAPVAVDDGGYAVDEDSSLSVDIVSGVRTNDTDVDGDGLSVSVTSPPSDGVLVLSADGSFDYTPDPDFSGVDSFVYQVSDGALTDTAVATITVNAINDPPQADPDSGYAVDEDAVLVVGAPSGVLTNDSDIDGDAITLNTTPVVLPTHGDVVLSLDGSFVYFPDPDYNGGDSFTYEISDGALTDTATVSITVDPTNDAPVALDDTGFVVAEDGSLVVGDLGGVLANDTDIDGDGLLVNTSPVVNVANGVLSLASDGSFTYTPTADYNGPDSFTYEISDGALTDTATVTITVNAVDDAPIANADAYVTDEDVDLSVGAPGLLDNDVDIDADGLTVNTTPVVDPTDGAVTLAADGSFLYEPDPGFAGVDTFTYEITDGIGTDTAVVTITITGAPTPPLAVDDAYTWVGGATYVQAALGGVLDNDLETEADPFTLTPIVGGATALGGTVDLGADGSFTYVPPAGVGSTVDSFDYTITDDDGSDVGSVDITLGTLVWFVDNAVAPGGDGTEDAPFDTLLAAETASGAGDVLYVMAGDGTPAGYDAGVVLSDDQRLIGEGVDLVVDAIALASAGGRPVLTNVGGVVVEIPDGASGDFEIAGLDLAEATFGIDVGTGLAPADAVSVHDVGIQLTTTGIASASGTLDVVDVDIVAGGGVVINEVHPDPDGVLGDANCDAVVSPTHDEFVEIVNHTEHPVNLTGATLSDASAVRHTFAPGTILDPGDAIVVFGGGTPSCSLPPNATHIVGDGSLSLANAGDSVTLTSAMGTVLDTMTYDGAEGSSDQSLVRSPELFGPFVRHATDAGHADLFSVGEAGDGSAFVAPSFPLVDGISASASSVSVVTSRVDGASGSGVTTSEVGTLVVDDTLLRVCGTGITVDYVSAVGPSVTLSDNVLVGNGVDALGMVDGITITGSPDSGVFAISGNDISGFASGGVVHLGDTVETIASVLTVSANTVHDFDGDAFLVLGDSGGTNAEYTFTLNAVDGGSAALGGLTPGAGVLVDAGALDDILVSITDNDFDDLAVAADFTLVTTSTVTSLIDGNAVGAASAVGAGGDAFAFGSAGSSTLNVTVDGNTISAGSGDITYATIGGACTVATAIAGNEAPGFVLDATSAGTFSLEGALPADTVTANLDDLLNTTSGGAPSVADSGTITIVGVGTIPTP